jgi:hypothetical protein
MQIIEEKKQKELSVIECNVIAKNPSSREVILFPSSFVITGYRMVSHEEKDFLKACDEVFKKDYSVECARKHVNTKFVSIIAMGGLYHDKVLKPEEIIERSIVFFVPIKQYDVIQAVVNVPTAREKKDIMVNWHYDKEKGQLLHTIYLQDSYGKREQIDRNNPLLKEIDFQFASSAKMLSLWGR